MVGYILIYEYFGNETNNVSLYACGRYATGSAGTTVNNFTNTSITSTTSISLPATAAHGSTGHAFIFKWNSDGSFNSWNIIQGNLEDRTLSITHKNNDLYVTGFYTTTTQFNINNFTSTNSIISSNIPLPITTNEAMFIMKYVNDKLDSWTTFDGVGSEKGLQILFNDYLYVCGEFNRNLLEIYNLTKTSTKGEVQFRYLNEMNSLTPFIVKFDLSGNVVNTK